MKKILFVILSIFILVGNVSAESKVTSFYTIINKCAVVKDNNAVIPVTVVPGAYSVPFTFTL